MNDGLLELAIVKKLPRRKLLPIIPSYHSGKYLDKHIKTGVVTYRQCKSLNIVAAKPQNVSIDGEIVPLLTLIIGIFEAVFFAGLVDKGLLSEINLNAKNLLPRRIFRFSVAFLSPAVMIILIIAQIFF